MPVGFNIAGGLVQPEAANMFSSQFDNAANFRKALLENALSAIKNKYAEPNLQASLLQQQLQNQYNPRIWESEIGLRGAQAGLTGAEAAKNRYFLEHPDLLYGGDVAQLTAMDRLAQALEAREAQQGEQLSGAKDIYMQRAMPRMSNMRGGNTIEAGVGAGGPPLTSQMVRELMRATIQKPIIDMQHTQKMTQGFDWLHMPENAKELEFGYANALGIDPSSYAQMRNSGMTLPDIAASMGKDLKEIRPEFLGSSSSLADQAKARAVESALVPLSEFVVEGMGPYAPTTIGGKPLAFGRDVLLNMNQDQQAKFLAANILSIEESLLRNNMLSGMSGKEAMEEVRKAAYGELENYSWLPRSEKVFSKTKELVNEQLSKALKEMNRGYEVGGNRGEKSKISDALNGRPNKEEGRTLKLINGRLVEQ